MKKNIFFGAATLMLAIGAIVATRANAPSPDYYINDANQCVLAPDTECQRGAATCKRDITGQTPGKQLYDVRTNNVCQFTLQEVAN